MRETQPSILCPPVPVFRALPPEPSRALSPHPLQPGPSVARTPLLSLGCPWALPLPCCLIPGRTIQVTCPRVLPASSTEPVLRKLLPRALVPLQTPPKLQTQKLGKSRFVPSALHLHLIKRQQRPPTHICSFLSPPPFSHPSCLAELRESSGRPPNPAPGAWALPGHSPCPLCPRHPQSWSRWPAVRAAVGGGHRGPLPGQEARVKPSGLVLTHQWCFSLVEKRNEGAELALPPASSLTAEVWGSCRHVANALIPQ